MRSSVMCFVCRLGRCGGRDEHYPPRRVELDRHLLVRAAQDLEAPVAVRLGRAHAQSDGGHGKVHGRVNSNAIEAIEAIEAIHLKLTTLSKLSTTIEAMPLHRYRRYPSYPR